MIIFDYKMEVVETKSPDKTCAALIRRSGKDVLCHCGKEDHGRGGGRHPRPDSGVAEVRGAYTDAVIVAAVPLP